MVKAKRARNAETLKQPSPCLRLRAPHFYPDLESVIIALCGSLFMFPVRLQNPQHPAPLHYTCKAQFRISCTNSLLMVYCPAIDEMKYVVERWRWITIITSRSAAWAI